MIWIALWDDGLRVFQKAVNERVQLANGFRLLCSKIFGFTLVVFQIVELETVAAVLVVRVESDEFPVTFSYIRPWQKTRHQLCGVRRAMRKMAEDNIARGFFAKERPALIHAVEFYVRVRLECCHRKQRGIKVCALKKRVVDAAGLDVSGPDDDAGFACAAFVQ